MTDPNLIRFRHLVAGALARSGGDKRDSGAHAARAVLALAEIRSQLALS